MVDSPYTFRPHVLCYLDLSILYKVLSIKTTITYQKEKVAESSQAYILNARRKQNNLNFIGHRDNY